MGYGPPGCAVGPRRDLDDERGAALIIALLVMGSLLLLGTAFLTISSTETQIAVNQRDAAQALFAAESGLAQARRDALYDYWQDQDLTLSRDTAGNLVQGLLAPGILEPYLIKEMAPDDPFYAYRNDYYRLAYPATATFTTVGTGGFRVYVRKQTFARNTITFRSIGFTPSGAQRDLEASYLVRNYSFSNNALFVNGAVKVDSGTAFQIAGSVHIRGTGLGPTDRAITVRANSTVVDHYGDMDAGLKARVPSIRNSPEDLRAEFRVKGGVTEIIGDPSTVGEPAGARDPLNFKTNLKGVYTTNGFTGARPDNVYSDNGKTPTYDATGDLDSSRFAFPDLTSTYLSPKTGLPETNPTTKKDYTYDGHILANSYQVNGPLIIRNDATVIGNTWYKSDGTTWNLKGGMDFSAYNKDGTITGFYGTYSAGTWKGSISVGSGSNTLSWNPSTGTLTISGVIAVRGDDNSGDVILGGGGKGPLTIHYDGRGTLYSQYDSEIHADLLPVGGTFPTDHSLGLIAGDQMRIGWPSQGGMDGGLSVPDKDQANLRIAATIFGQNTVAVGNNTQIAGAIVAKDVRLKNNPKIFQVPALANPRTNLLAPEVPGGAPIYRLQIVTWREITP